MNVFGQLEIPKFNEPAFSREHVNSHHQENVFTSKLIQFCKQVDNLIKKSRKCLESAKISESEQSKVLFYFLKMDLSRILFLGPTCGICSLSMLFSGNPTIDDLLKKSQEQNYTNNGEMFSGIILH